MRWADYSAGRPGSSALRSAGFGGAIRYAGLGRGPKRLTGGEYRELVDGGVTVALVIEQGTDDAWGSPGDDDFARGVAFGQAGLADARGMGIPDSVLMACAADQHAAPHQLDDVVQFARGFTSVVGRNRAGFYGFSETLRAVHDAGIVSWYWRCGSQPTAAERTWTNLWQRNDGTVSVAGIPCDINEEYLPLPTGGAAPVAGSTDEETLMLIPAAPDGDHFYIPLAGRPPYLYLFAGYGDTVEVKQMDFVRPSKEGTEGDFVPGAQLLNFTFLSDRPGPLDLRNAAAAGAVGISIWYRARHSFTAYVG
ncbi:glycoside hydrolase domain-containing protein [Amycolatopsis jejuensis]|uniref:glycoside hydrolase domain-containing protein n=1 Tax=Amycolatopsis jejuensis TaxID=330084 RepID=UPI00052470EB|nr:glycoside hydrolase domain-containing protein [Amycolatopsis jejuensis]